MASHSDDSGAQVVAILLVLLLLVALFSRNEERETEPRSGETVEQIRPLPPAVGEGRSTPGPRHTWSEVAARRSELELTLNEAESLLR